MPNNFWWVFASYSVVWIAMFAYVVRLYARPSALETVVQRLEDERRGD